MSGKKPAKLSLGKIIFLIISAQIIIGGLILITISPLFALIIFYFGGPIIGNILSYYSSRIIYERTNINPLLLAFLSIVFQAAIISLGILLTISAHNGQIVTCGNVCEGWSFFDLFRQSFFVAQAFFIGGYIFCLYQLAVNMMSKKQKTKKKHAKKKRA